MHAANRSGEETTLVLQPLIQAYTEPTAALAAPREVRRAIMAQLEQFHVGSERLRKTRRLLPDLAGKGNLVIADPMTTPHLVLLDNGLIDQHAASPLIDLYSVVMYHGRLRNVIRQFRASLERP